MNVTAICKKIFEVALPVSKETSAPIAYITVSVGASVPCSDKELWETFNKIRWDTELSSAELNIIRMQTTGDPLTDRRLSVDSLSEFEDDTGASLVHPIPAVSGSIMVTLPAV
jgi:hypothetical protein